MYWDRAVQIFEGGPVRFSHRLHNAAGGLDTPGKITLLDPGLNPRNTFWHKGFHATAAKSTSSLNPAPSSVALRSCLAPS